MFCLFFFDFLVVFHSCMTQKRDSVQSLQGLKRQEPEKPVLDNAKENSPPELPTLAMEYEPIPAAGTQKAHTKLGPRTSSEPIHNQMNAMQQQKSN